MQSRRRSEPILSPHSTSVPQKWVNDIFSTVWRRVTPWVLGGYQPSGILWVTFIRPEAGPDLRIETLLASSSHSFSRCWLFYFNLCAIWWLVKNMQLKSLNPHIGRIQSPSPCHAVVGKISSWSSFTLDLSFLCLSSVCGPTKPLSKCKSPSYWDSCPKSCS